jgi:hypothetical protein
MVRFACASRRSSSVIFTKRLHKTEWGKRTFDELHLSVPSSHHKQLSTGACCIKAEQIYSSDSRHTWVS